VYELTGKKLNIPDETQEGEFYLDSLGVYPNFRNRGVGIKLVETFCKNVFDQGHKCVGLLVDYTNPIAESIYIKLGFGHIDNKMFFDHKMKHLVKTR
jgi:predicted GNAT family acetyltransferase